MDRDYIWEGEYGRRSHLIPVFQQLLREQDASSLQMLSLFVNNNPYNLEFFIAVSYDRPKEEHLDRMFRLLEDAGLRQRKDLTARNIMRAMADRRFNSASLLDEDRPEIRTSGSGIGVRNVAPLFLPGDPGPGGERLPYDSLWPGTDGLSQPLLSG